MGGAILSRPPALRLSAGGGFPAFAAVLDFRFTSGFVTDPTNGTWVIQDKYPTVRAGFTFGWISNSTVEGRDRTAAVDPRLAGINFDGSSANSFQLDLPAAGTYSVRLALGDALNPGTEGVTVKDGATTLFTVPTTATTAGNFLDATGATLSSAAWPAGNTAKSVVMSGTALTLVFPAAGQNNIANLSVTRTA